MWIQFNRAYRTSIREKKGEKLTDFIESGSAEEKQTIETMYADGSFWYLLTFVCLWQRKISVNSS